jgi:signal transduction histidine kinase
MKLLAKYNRVNITATILVLLLAGVSYYFILRIVLIHQLDKDLRIEEQEIRDHVINNGALPSASRYKDQQISFEETTGELKRKIKTISVYDKHEKEDVTSRQLTFSLQAAGKNVAVSITKSLQETEDLVKLIVWLTLSIVALLLITLFIVNRLLFRNLWAPFNHTLQQLKLFSVNNKKEMVLQNSNINEFNELNNAVLAMGNRVTADYDAMKSFTENASHEIQTPLAVVNTKLELLMQSENFSEQQLQYIQSISGEVNRLSKLNQSLLLLTKIDNRQFTLAAEVDLSAIIEKYITNYEELLAAKKIVLQKEIKPGVTIFMNETMAGVLVSNLITNAIKHNIDGGSITIMLNEEKLQISNTGQPLSSKPSALFERFKKDRVNSDSLGLGLSIVKKICLQNHFTVNYNYSEPLHTIMILFR